MAGICRQIHEFFTARVPEGHGTDVGTPSALPPRSEDVHDLSFQHEQQRCPSLLHEHTDGRIFRGSALESEVVGLHN